MPYLPMGIKKLLGCAMLMLSLASCSKIVESMLEKPTDTLVDQDHQDGVDTQPDLDADQGDDTTTPDTPSEDILYEVNHACFEMTLVMECEPLDTCQNGTTPGCGEKCDEQNNRNADGCDPCCFFETKVCTWAVPFVRPADIVVAGNMVLVADAGDHTIKMINVSGTNDVSLVAGIPQQPGHNNGDGATAQFSSPSGIEMVGDYDIIVVDTDNNRIRKIHIDIPVSVSDLAGEGTATYRDGACRDAQFNNPIGIAVDESALYIADSGNKRIRKITDPLDDTLCTVSTIAGPDGFSKPTGIAWNMIDPANLYVADEGRHIIVRVERNGSLLPVFIAGNPDSTGGSTDRAQGTAVGFNMPTGIDSNGEILVVAEKGRNLLREIELYELGELTLCDQCWVTTLAGSPSSQGCTPGDTGGAARLFDPTCVAFDKRNLPEGMYRVFFCDPGCNAVRIVK